MLERNDFKTLEINRATVLSNNECFMKNNTRSETKCNKLVIFTVPFLRQINQFSHYLNQQNNTNSLITK